ncbi:chaplin family protein [Streptomyces sp. WG5]|uniref:chaplin family protein n=1 Tax=Streptomyces sp. WG5 TaxID=3417648 RepID=UPI003CEDBC4B
MRQTLSRGMVAAAAATSILTLCGSPALADSSANGTATNSSDTASGSAAQAPADAPAHVCGSTADGMGTFGAASGNECANHSDKQADGSRTQRASHGDDVSAYGSDADGGHDSKHGEDPRLLSGLLGSHASGEAEASSGAGSGNHAKAVIEMPFDLCGSTASVIAALNPVFGDVCGHESPGDYGYGDDDDTPVTTPPADEEKTPPAEEEKTPPAEEDKTPPAHEAKTPPHKGKEQPPALAETGSEVALGTAAAGAALLAGGAILYRRGRAAYRR